MDMAFLYADCHSALQSYWEFYVSDSDDSDPFLFVSRLLARHDIDLSKTHPDALSVLRIFQLQVCITLDCKRPFR